MTRDAQASVRLPKELKDEIQRIAQETRRTLSSTIELLLMKGVEAYREDGYLLDTRPRQPEAGTEPAFSKRRKAS